MNETVATTDSMPVIEDFAAMLDESLGESGTLERTVVSGTVIAIENDSVLIDVGLKSEGRVSLKELSSPGQTAEINVGDKISCKLISVLFLIRSCWKENPLKFK